MSAKLILRPHDWARNGLTHARGLAFDASGRMLSAADWPYAKRIQRALRRLRWRRQYDGVEGMGWFALVDREQFRGLYTGREIGHSFFALKYLDAITPADKFEGRS